MFGSKKDNDVATKKPEDSYFLQLCEGQEADLASRIKLAVEKDGVWSESEEWRISTWTDKSVKKIEANGRVWFEVSVKCDHEFVCHAPTAERAAQFVWLYQRMIVRLFHQLGWPSWLSLKEHPNAVQLGVQADRP